MTYSEVLEAIQKELGDNHARGKHVRAFDWICEREYERERMAANGAGTNELRAFDDRTRGTKHDV